MPDRPRIAMTLTQFWHGVPGGTATSMERLARSLTDGGRVELIGVGPRGNLRRPRSVLDPAAEVGHWLPDAMIYMPLPLPVLYDSWERIGRPRITGRSKRFDLVHLTVPVTPPEDKVPLVATVHDVFPITHPELMTRRGARLMSRGLAAIGDRAERIIVSTRSVADGCMAAGFAADKLAVIPFGVDPVEVDDSEVTMILDKYGITGPYLLFVGTMEPRKNLGLLLEALIQIDDPGLTLVLAGPSGWEGRVGDSVGPRIEDVPSPVIRLGFVPGEDLPALQHGAAAFCFPSLVEGFGLPVLEAMAAGSVVITSNVGGTAEVAGDAALLVDPSDPAAMVAAIRTALTDESAAKELRQAALDRSHGFSWAASADAVEDVYESVLR